MTPADYADTLRTERHEADQAARRLPDAEIEYERAVERYLELVISGDPGATTALLDVTQAALDVRDAKEDQ